MTIQLLDGKFEKKDALHLLTEMIAIKIKFHESKIKLVSNEEDTKMRETKIKHLQNSLKDLRTEMELKDSTIYLSSEIEID